MSVSFLGLTAAGVTSHVLTGRLEMTAAFSATSAFMGAVTP